MSDTKRSPIIVKISNRDDYRKFATPFGIKIGERGKLPHQDFINAIVPGLADGSIKIEDTDFFSLTIATGARKAGKSDEDVTYTITYHVLNSKTGKPMPGDKTLTVTTNEVRSYLPHLNARGALSAATALMVVAIAKAKDGALLSDLQKYVILKVVKVGVAPEAVVPAETTSTPVEGEDTEEVSDDAVTVDETAEESAKELVNA